MRRHACLLETVSVTVPEAALPAYEAALSQACSAVGLFLADEEAGTWRVEGVKAASEDNDSLASALAIASLSSGVSAVLERSETEAEGWLARTCSAFPEQCIGRRFAIRGTHLETKRRAGRMTLLVDAGLAFGSGEHGSTRGCLRALEKMAHRKPRRLVDMGCGSGILAMAAGTLLKRQVLAIDNDPWSVRVAAQNAKLNGLGRLVQPRLGNGWQGRGAAKYDLVLANILARPLCLMARHLARRVNPGATVILSGLLVTQIRMVLAAHRRVGLRLERILREGDWATMVLRA